MKSLKAILIFINVCICFSFGFFVLMFNQLGQPFTRGFYCKDESISKPFKESTIPSATVVIISCILGFFCFVLTDIVNFVLLDSIGSVPFCHRIRRVKKPLLRNLVILILIYILGMGVTMFITDIGKYSVGRLRPHFLDVCKPDWSKLNCTNSDGTPRYFVGNEFCTNNKKDTWRFKDARLSFPSGHASYSAYIATFLVLYLHKFLVFTNPFACLPKLFLQIGISSGAVYCGFSRISDYKHHPTDVLAGLVIGFLVGITIFCYVLSHSCLPLLKVMKGPPEATNSEIRQHYGTSDTTNVSEIYQPNISVVNLNKV